MSASTRQNFRVKMDCSKIIQDVRQLSWVFIDSTKILFVHHLTEHIQKLFDIKNPFFLVAKYEDKDYFLPFEEDIRILENNDTIVVIPDENNTFSLLNNLDSQSNLNSFGYHSVSVNYKTGSQVTCEKSSYISDKSFIPEKPTENAIEANPSETTLGNSFYRTALYDTIEENKSSDTAKENNVENKSIIEDGTTYVKRKRVRKRKQKKTDNITESDTSFSELTNKKPRIIDSILISSGKHIRFEGITDEVQPPSVTNGNMEVEQNFDLQNKEFETKDLSALLNLKNSSTPLTFSHKKKKKVINKHETIDEIKPLDFNPNVLTTVNDNSSTPYSCTESNKQITEDETENVVPKNDKNTPKSLNDTVSFKVFRIGEDYTPQLSSIILAQVLSTEDSQYKLKILHGQDQLQDPQGKFSLPNDDENANATNENVIILDKSQLIEFTKVEAI